MSARTEILARFSGKGGEQPLYLPDLSLWYAWHHKQGTLPEAWQGYSLPQVARAMGVPIFLAFQPWRMEMAGAQVTTTEREGERLVAFESDAGALVARWALMPGGDWWQTEYPVKSAEDLAVALEVARARTYALDPAGLAQAREEVGDDGLVVLQIPRRPYSDLLHEFLGWSEGLMLLGEPLVREILAVLEAKLQAVVAEMGTLPGEIVLAPDNLDGQFISPRMFQRELAGSYRRTAEMVQGQGKRLLVHAGGPIRHLLAPLREAGVDGVEGIAGPPQSNATLAEARAVAGPDLTLWGGIPQDFLLDAHEWQRFEEAVRQAASEARDDPRVLLGVADRVPVEAEPDRLLAIPSLAGR